MTVNPLNLSGKVVLVTGSTRGIGKAIVRQLLLQGAIVIANSRSKDIHISDIFTEFGENSEIDYYACDVTNSGEVKKMMKGIFDKYGKIDILINNVGSSTKESLIGTTEVSMDSLYEVNLKSVFIVTKCVLKYMLKQRNGNIIHIGSVAGLDGMGMQAHYAAFKSALWGYTKSIISEYGRRGIRVNIVAPGAITGNPLYTKEDEEQIIKKVPLGRLGTTQDIAFITGYLASDMSSYINGQIIRVDGGIRI